MPLEKTINNIRKTEIHDIYSIQINDDCIKIYLKSYGDDIDRNNHINNPLEITKETLPLSCKTNILNGIENEIITNGRILNNAERC